MKKAKVAITVVMVMIMLMVMTKIVKAAENFSCTVTMTSSSEKVKGGDTISINVLIDQIILSDGSTGVFTFDGDLEYDKDIFEVVTRSNIETEGDRTPQFNSSKQHVSILGGSEEDAISVNGTKMFSIQMKVKENAKFDTTEIKFNDIILSDNNQDYSIDSAKVVISLDKAEETEPPTTPPTIPPTEPPTTPPTKQPVKTPTEPPTTPPTTVPTTKPTTNPTSKLPQTGIENTGIIVIFSASLIGCGILFYKYKKYNNITK